MQELLAHFSHMRSGIVMHQKEPRANRTSIWSHNGSEDHIPNESDVFQRLICKEFRDLQRYIAEEESHFLKLVATKATERINSIETQLQQRNEILRIVRDKERQLENLGNDSHLHFIQVNISSKVPFLPRSCQPPLPRCGDSSYSAIFFKPGFRQDDIKLTVWKRLHRRVLPSPEVLKLDPLTAHPLLQLSRGDTVVQCKSPAGRRGSNPEGFENSSCVLATRGFSTGKHYWEVIVGTKQKWRIGVVKGTVSRKGKMIRTPEAGAWLIGLKEGRYYEAFTSPSVCLPIQTRPQRIGVFLNYEKGELMFYNADNPDELIPLYTFHAEFQGKLYPVLDVCWQERGTNPQPLILPTSVAIKDP
ncbi:unnamed protein product [Ranitomeya imitator]|uniref:B30.2/SPRY domain-containing protein n=1 Tax=Ranitomeya imitator TaxID=111125 RepID=A0ABN9LWZ0_9NEOB|nr:unnamed protein product [Ranitomeya imitator]